MRVNSRVFTERTDMLQELYVKDCPAQFKKEADNLLNMVAQPGYSVGEYHTMTELDKKLMVDYWETYDGLNLEHIEFEVTKDFKRWFVTEATPPELIRRARQFLSERNYIIINETVKEHAEEAGNKFRQSIRGK